MVSSRVQTEQELNLATENEKRLEEKLDKLKIKFVDFCKSSIHAWSPQT